MSQTVQSLQELSFELLSKEEIDYLIINRRDLLPNKIQQLDNVLIEIDNDIKEFEVLQYNFEFGESIFIFINDDWYIKIKYYLDDTDFMTYTYLKPEIINRNNGKVIKSTKNLCIYEYDEKTNSKKIKPLLMNMELQYKTCFFGWDYNYKFFKKDNKYLLKIIINDDEIELNDNLKMLMVDDIYNDLDEIYYD